MATVIRVILAATLVLAAVLADANPAPAGARAVELTSLKSQPGQRENLKRFIVLNWFAIDRITREQGSLHAYTVMDTGSDDGPWNVVVAMTYRDARGYSGIAQAFEKIRKSHRTVLVDGKALQALGSVVEAVQLLEDPADAAP